MGGDQLVDIAEQGECHGRGAAVVDRVLGDGGGGRRRGLGGGDRRRCRRRRVGRRGRRRRRSARDSHEGDEEGEAAHGHSIRLGYRCPRCRWSYALPAGQKPWSCPWETMDDGGSPPAETQSSAPDGGPCPGSSTPTPISPPTSWS